MNRNRGQHETRVATSVAARRGAPRRAVSSRLSPTVHCLLPTAHARRGLTLIELLVTIAILVTVLGGVVPMLSPNNDARKIREASRQLNGMLAQAQAQAARDGRAVGVAFREFGNATTRSGMALEAFFIAEPKPFAGFSPNSRAMLRVNYNYSAGLPPTAARDMSVRFVIAGTTPPVDDPIPPNTIRRGDVVELGGLRFRIVHDDQDGDGQADVDANNPNAFKDGDYYTSTDNAEFICVWEDLASMPTAQAPPLAIMQNVSASGYGWTAFRPYIISRQPRNTSGAPLQFPTGVGIDMDVSGATGRNVPGSFDSDGVNTVGVMFAPNGTLQSLYYDGKLYTGAERVYLHVGRFENGNNGDQDSLDYDFVENPSQTDDDLIQRRGRINWLNPDSRWVAVNRAGRIITAENNLFNPHDAQFVGDSEEYDARQQRRRQIEGARAFAEAMSSEGGR